MIENLGFENETFLLSRAVESLGVSIESLGSPVLTVSSTARQYVNSHQIVGIDSSFLRRVVILKDLLAEVRQQFKAIKSIDDLYILQSKLQHARERYLQSEQVFDYYVDLLHTRSEHNMGPILKGCDALAFFSLRDGLRVLNLETPPVICYLDRGMGASILRAGIYLWDGQTNPAAIIKVVRSSIPLPRITSILHECGHQAAAITNWNSELAQLLKETITKAGGNTELAQLWESWATEVAADFWALHQCNFASVVGLSEVIAGRPEKVFMIIPGDPHPMGYLRVLLGLVFCRKAFGDGPWDNFENAWKRLYPLESAQPESALVVRQSIPLLEIICTVVSKTKMKAFKGNSLEQLLPVMTASPEQIRNLLNKSLTDFSVECSTLTKRPINALIGFRVIHMFGGKPIEWVSQRMKNWLTKLSIEELN